MSQPTVGPRQSYSKATGISIAQDNEALNRKLNLLPAVCQIVDSFNPNN